MASSQFSVSKASSVSFVISREVGTINNGILDTDFNFLNEEIADFYNCNLSPINYCQAWKWGDTIRFQFLYINTTTELPPTVRLLDSAGGFIQYIVPIDATAVYGLTVDFVWAAVFDTSVLPQPSSTVCDCYSFEISTIDPDETTNFFACGDFGTFEAALGTWAASTGGNNTLGQSVFGMSHSGNFSAIVTANAVPNAASYILLHCNAATTYTADQYYLYSGWVYIDSGNPIAVLAGDTISWDVSDLTDADVVYEAPALAGTLDVWQQFTILFKTGADVSGTPKARLTGVPAANGVAFFDDFEYFETNTITEATSQKVCLCDDIKCSAQFFYYAGNGKTEMQIVGFGLDGIQSFNVACSFRRFKFDDQAHTTQKESDGHTSLIIAEPEKIYTFKTNPVPAYMVEKITLAMKFSNVLIRPSGDLTANGVFFVMHSKNPTIEWEENSGASDMQATVEWEMVPADYNYKKANC